MDSIITHTHNGYTYTYRVNADGTVDNLSYETPYPINLGEDNPYVAALIALHRDAYCLDDYADESLPAYTPGLNW